MIATFMNAPVRHTADLTLPALCVLALLGSVGSAAADCGSRAGPGVDWEGCSKRNIILTESDLSKAKLAGANMNFTDLRASNLDGAHFEKTMLARTYLDDSKAVGADFDAAAGYRTSFVNANLKDASFRKAEMQRGDFSGSDLTNVSFEKAELGRANFSNAELAGAQFPFANLARADFRGARLDGPIDLTGSFTLLTRFDGVDLTSAVGLVQWQIDMACGDEMTKLPEGFTPSDTWPCGEEE